jgi:streptogramin lyase
VVARLLSFHPVGRRGLVLGLVGLSMVWLGAAAPAHAAFGFLKQWGGTGSANGKFQGGPFDLATDADGNVYVADSGNDRVQKFTPEGEFVAKWGTTGGGNSQFTEPSGIDVGPNEAVYAADYVADGRIQMFGTGGGFLTAWRSELTGALDSPFGVATDGAGNVYVTDQGNARVQRFSPTGAFISTFGGPGNFDQPLGITVDRAGNVYVVDSVNDNVQKFTSTGDPITTFDFGAGLSGPTGIATDPDGNLYLTDSGNDRVLHFTPTGAVISQFGGPGGGSGTFLDPTGVATDCRGNVYVIDAGHNLVQKFGDPADPPPPCAGRGPPGLQLEVDAAPRQKVKRLEITVTCQLEACSAGMGGRVKGKVKARLQPQEHDLEAGEPQTIPLGYQGSRTVKRLRKALRKHKVRRKARAAIAVEATDADGQSDLEQLEVKLRR